jgi:hypothetical protein
MKKNQIFAGINRLVKKSLHPTVAAIQRNLFNLIKTLQNNLIKTIVLSKNA